MATTRASEPDSSPPDREPASVVRWIPVVVPLAAVLLAILVYLIGAEVL